MNVTEIRYKLEFGIPPLTLDECRWLFEQATGEKVAGKKRCPTCNAEGFVGNPAANFECKNCCGKGYLSPCKHCHGTGWLDGGAAKIQCTWCWQGCGYVTP